MTQRLDFLPETASQTAGPYVHIGLMPSHAGNDGALAQELGTAAICEGAAGQRIRISGQITDGTGAILYDALLESWQADAGGVYPGQPDADPEVLGFCRFAISADRGTFTLDTIKPGPVALPDGRVQAPHIALWIVARGINTGLSTRIYFADEDNSQDPVLSRIAPPSRADTLIAKPDGIGGYRFDICLQGPQETVFLDM